MCLFFFIFHVLYSKCILGFPGGSVKNPPVIAGNMGSIPGSRRSPGKGNGYSLQYSCLENSRYRGAWRATDHGVTKSAQCTMPKHMSVVKLNFQYIDRVVPIAARCTMRCPSSKGWGSSTQGLCEWWELNNPRQSALKTKPGGSLFPSPTC